MLYEFIFLILWNKTRRSKPSSYRGHARTYRCDKDGQCAAIHSKMLHARHTCKLPIVLCSLFFVLCFGAARAATCNAGYYLDDAGKCVGCPACNYCPGDDTKIHCPLFTQTIQDVLELSGLQSIYSAACTSREQETYPYTITNCGMGLYTGSGAYDKDGNKVYAFLNYETQTGLYTKFTLQYYILPGVGIWLQDEAWSGAKLYKLANKCTNAPTNAHYTGGVIGENNCPWECDAGYGHTSDDRCLPLCRIGDTAMNGINIYAEKHTKYAMAVPRNGATCWINAKRDNGGKLVPVN
ncbi:MAG: hypothetical protein IJ560_00600 [Alphaproteobacteria bacterium]|nr:hypothetical protein [Alphaproteobacteria bacterium]